MARLKLIWFVSISGIVVAIAWLCFRPLSPVSSQALAVSFVGYTNLPSGDKAAVFTVSNQWNITVKRWAVVYLESAPFALTNTPKQWRMDQRSNIRDRYFKPKESEQLIIRDALPGREWRLRVPWSTGVRANVALAVRKHSRLPQFLRIAPEYYAFSDSVVQ